ncbi:MAG: thioredoxin family protein [Burkholderiaceae bacterium]|jgi:thiol-disulfide isomerase/thioredoxin|nr:thioredoxin family protein [Burkholderiaceae bacterium]MCO5103870.1 thioredoxin family protein [Burkholderiaceae bacterium]
MEHSAAPNVPADSWWVVCLCAAWCNTCTDYRPIFRAVAGEWPQMRFEWVDIEDESELAGDLDVETFPTVLIADADGARFLGPLLPHAAVLSRLIASLRDAAPGGQAQTDPEAQAVFDRVRLARR